MKFSGDDVGIFTFGRCILAQMPRVSLEFYLNEKSKEGVFSSSELWDTTICKILENITTRGRIACIADRENVSAQNFIDKISHLKEPLPYSPQKKKYTNTPYKTIFFPVPLLHKIACEGMSDSVEFRRLSRRFLRDMKNHNCDTFWFMDAIFAEEKTKKILQHIVGKSRKCVFMTDFFNPAKVEESEKQQIVIHADHDQKFVKMRAEKILRTKLKS